MRLIETWDVLKYTFISALLTLVLGLIETWDVLKYIPERELNAEWRINRNMGCIEIELADFKELVYTMINRNMGCIEIYTRERVKC